MFSLFVVLTHRTEHTFSTDDRPNTIIIKPQLRLYRTNILKSLYEKHDKARLIYVIHYSHFKTFVRRLVNISNIYLYIIERH